MIASRVEIMCEMDIAESRVPQDGRAQFEFAGRWIDLRLSMVPSAHGPKIAIRILDRFTSILRLEELGFSEDALMQVRHVIHKPHGIVLATGPTGCGKTTTLYAMLAEIRDVATNVMTVEDPIEYEMAGVTQTQINEKAGLTFGRQLRSLMRQDPDVILVGEIRDMETVETAMRASLTGHLVLSSLHTNDAIGAIPRLLDMGCDPFLLGTSLVGVLSQR